MDNKRGDFQIILVDKQPYRMEIKCKDPVEVVYTAGINRQNVILEVGKKYIILIDKPTTKQDRARNNRIVEILGFSDVFFQDAIVRYLDNNRRGRVWVSCLLPYQGDNLIDVDFGKKNNPKLQ